MSDSRARREEHQQENLPRLNPKQKKKGKGREGKRKETDATCRQASKGQQGQATTGADKPGCHAEKKSTLWEMNETHVNHLRVKHKGTIERYRQR